MNFKSITLFIFIFIGVQYIGIKAQENKIDSIPNLEEKPETEANKRISQAEPSSIISLAEGTLIMMDDNTTEKIEDLEEGDKVLTYNYDSQTYTPKTILAIHKSLNVRLVHIKLKNKMQITTTFAQPLLSNRGWVSISSDSTISNVKYPRIRKAKIGSKIQLYDKKSAKTELSPTVIIEGRNDVSTTYSLQIEGEEANACIANGFIVGLY